MIKDLSTQELWVKEIKNKIIEQFGKESYGMTTKYKYRKEVKWENPGRKPDQHMYTFV